MLVVQEKQSELFSGASLTLSRCCLKDPLLQPQAESVSCMLAEVATTFGALIRPLPDSVRGERSRIIHLHDRQLLDLIACSCTTA